MRLTPEDIAALIEALDIVVRTKGLDAAPVALALAQKLRAIEVDLADGVTDSASSQSGGP